MSKLSDNDRTLFLRTFINSGEDIRFFMNYREGRSVRLCGNFIPENTEDPLDYLRQNECIDPSVRESYDIFYDIVQSEINHSTGKTKHFADVPICFDGKGNYILCHIYIALNIGDEGRADSAYLNIGAYSEKEISEREIISKFTSDKDPKVFSERVKRLINKNPGRKIAFVQFDVERFKIINDTYGVEKGDELLKYFKDSLSAICSDDRPFTRLTADVFMIVMMFDDEDEIIEFIHGLENTFGGKYKDIEYRLIFGVAIAEDRNADARVHSDNATLARRSVKGNALKNIGFYNGGLKTALYHQVSIEEDMNHAVQNDEFAMYLQPKYSISAGKIIGAEALARWIHPTKGLIMPADFVPIFEKNGFIVKLDEVMWEKACMKIREWIDRGIEPVPISVNISRGYLNYYDVVGKFKELVKKYDIPINLLEAEITESVDAFETTAVVKRMKDSGFTMLMDDFGSGYSSLNMLKTTPFDVLKIDRGFLSEFMESERGRKIIAHTISMSHDIGLDIIAEGVETDAQAKFLSECGCDTAQGFLYSKPISEKDFDEKLCGNK